VGHTAGLRPWAADRCLGFTCAEQATPDRACTFYDPGDGDRLTLLKARYDPADMFRASPIIPRASETRLTGRPEPDAI
jgi:hypothetical protein